MKKIIPFTKIIPFNEEIKEILSISLDHDLSIKEQLLSGNFYIKGNYLPTNTDNKTEYSYKIPFEITISPKYDVSDTEFDIEDFYYEITDNNELKINIEVYIDGLKEKEEEKKEPLIEKEEKEIKEELMRNDEESIVKVEDVLTNINSNNEEKYTAYNIYIFRENDTLSEIMDKYHINKEDLSEYNDLENIKTGSKIIIPSNKNE